MNLQITKQIFQDIVTYKILSLSPLKLAEVVKGDGAV